MKRMTIQEALNQVDEMMPNLVNETTKIDWLGDLDAMIYDEVILTHAPDKMHREMRCDDPRHDWFDPLSPGRDDRKLPRPEHGTYPQFAAYDATTPLDTELLAPRPYHNIYRHYLAAQISLQNKEMDAYNNEMTLFNNAYQTYVNWYNRTHMPVPTARIRL